MKMPSVSISFTETAATAVKRGEKGIIAMILKDKSTVKTKGAVVISSAADIPSDWSAENKEQITLALKGYVNAPLRIIAYILDSKAADYTEALNYFKTVKFNYLVAPTVATDLQADAIVSYVKAQREENKLIKAILPNTASDCEAIINYATEKAYADDKEYTAEQYCSRIAGIIAGTPLSISCTYAPLSELTDCARLSKAEMDKAIEDGKFIIWFDGEKVKTARGINSLVTLTDSKNTQFQKIKIVDTLDMIADDIRMTAQDNYLGKYANTYDNKCLLLSAIENYFYSLVSQNVISKYSIEIDVDANRNYLKGRGENVDTMADDEIKRANTGSWVFLKAKLSINDAIEDIELPIAI